MDDGREKLIRARDRALRAVSLAGNDGDARAAWRLAKAHNKCAREKFGASGQLKLAAFAMPGTGP